MKRCEVIIGPTTAIVVAGSTGEKSLDYSKKRYGSFIKSLVDKEGNIAYLLFMTNSAEDLAKALNEDELFSKEELDITIKGGIIEDGKMDFKELTQFKGTLHDILLYVANEGSRYDKS